MNLLRMVINAKISVIALFLSALVPSANAWMEKWAPVFKSDPVEVKKLSSHSVSNFVKTPRSESPEAYALYSGGYSCDLNEDGIDDFMFIIPWMGCGLNASLDEVFFIVSDGKGGRIENVADGYGIEPSDLVKVKGKIYFRHSYFIEELEKSKHNHWAYQIFSFGKDGVMRCANGEVGSPFPAVTIFYDNPKFKQIELTAADLKKMADETKVAVEKYKL